MLQSLHVKNIALIDDVEIDFEKGLNILTGETGAGKSILIDSVNFALGKRMPKQIVRDDAQYALCELVFNVDDEVTLNQLSELDIPIENGEVILQRKILNGKNVCKCNGETVSAASLSQIASFLIDIHGQHEHQSLLYKKNHKTILDSFCAGDFCEVKSKLEECFDSFKKVEKEYEDAVLGAKNRERDMDYASFVIDEIDKANLKAGEDSELEAAYLRMSRAGKIAEALSAVKSALDDDNAGAKTSFGRVVYELKSIVGRDEEAESMYDEAVQIEDMMGGLSRTIEEYEQSLMFSPEEFAECEERLNEINKLKSKYGDTIEKILEFRDEEDAKLCKLSDYESYLNNLTKEKEKLWSELLDLCKKVSDRRVNEAKRLSVDIIAALKDLNFLDARFEIKITPDINNVSRSGYDDVEFMISTNPGESIKPLTMVASGGELSRIMLALKAVLAVRDTIGTLIFDEIDTGISGKTAALVANKMSDIAKIHQVICVTHLPQIASHADAHFEISKSVVQGHTSTRVESLDEENSIRELARMLSGDEITDAVLENAREMKLRR